MAGKVTDMTKGSPSRHIFAFALPMFIGSIFQQAYSMADMAVVGHTIGERGIAAIGATSAFYSLLIDLAFGMNNGYSIVASHRFGAGDDVGLRRTVAGIFVLNAVIALALTAGSLIFIDSILAMMNTPSEIADDALPYITVVCGGMFATIGYNMFSAIMRALGNSRVPLYFLILSSILNIILDIVAVSALGLGVVGAAWATVIAQIVSAALCALFISRVYRERMPKREDFIGVFSTFRALLPMGMSMGMMYCLVDIGSVIFQRANNALGEIFITAHTAARRVIVIMMQPVAMLGAASAAFTGQNWGAARVDRIKLGMKSVMQMEIAWSAIAIIVIFAFGSSFVSLVTGSSDPEVISLAVLSMRIHLAFFPPLGVLIAMRNIMQAVGQKAAPIISSAIELGVKFFSAAVVIPRIGYLGTCMTEPASWVVMMIFLVVAFFARGKKAMEDAFK